MLHWLGYSCAFRQSLFQNLRRDRGLAAAAPLLFSLASYLKRGEFEAVEDLQNGAEVPPEPAAEVVEQAAAQAPLDARYQS